MKNDETIDSSNIPVLAYLQDQLATKAKGPFGRIYQSGFREGFVDMLGDVDILRVLRVSSWLRHTLLQDSSWANRQHTAQNEVLMNKAVVCSTASAHALTLCMAHKHKVSVHVTRRYLIVRRQMEMVRQ